MTETKTIVASAVAVVLLGGMFFVSNKPINVNVNPSPITVNPSPITTNLGDTTVNPSDITVNPATNEQQFGAMPGPDISSNYLCVGGVCEWSFRKPMVTGASTTCSFRSPTSTSTIEFASLAFAGTASSSRMGITLATSTGPMATSTFIFGFGNGPSQEWTSTGGTDIFVFSATTTAGGYKSQCRGSSMATTTGPTQCYVNFGISDATINQGTGYNGSGIAGWCQVKFREIK